MRSRLDLEQAKQQLDVFTLWQLLGLPHLPASRRGGEVACRSPFREDRHPSFSVRGDGRLWHDHGTDEGGDAIDFLAMARGHPRGSKQAVAEFLALAGGDGARGITPQAPRPPAAPIAPRVKPTPPPDLREPTAAEIEAIVKVRGWPERSAEGLRLAGMAGILRVGTLRDSGTPRPAWFVTDASGRSIQGRRLDGLPWEWHGRKAWSVKDSDHGWPVGLSRVWQADPRAAILLLEGGPDLLAAWCILEAAGILHDAFPPAVVPAALCGAGARIAEDVLEWPGLLTRTVITVAHQDEAGLEGEAKWRAQLLERKAAVVRLNLAAGWGLPPGGKDLSDAWAASPDNLADSFRRLLSRRCQAPNQTSRH